jgi:hypothetical protein
MTLPACHSWPCLQIDAELASYQQQADAAQEIKRKLREVNHLDLFMITLTSLLLAD